MPPSIGGSGTRRRVVLLGIDRVSRAGESDRPSTSAQLWFTRDLFQGTRAVTRGRLDSDPLCAYRDCKIGSIPATQDWPHPNIGSVQVVLLPRLRVTENPAGC